MKIYFLLFLITIIIRINQAQAMQIRDSLKDKILQKFEKRVCKNKSNNTGLLLVHSPSLDIHWKTAISPNKSEIVNPDQPYHFASIGKTITSIMISILYEKEMIDFEDKISLYLTDSMLEGLHTFKGTDYSRNIKIKHLLNHTSGLADYYTDKNKDNISLSNLMISEPDRFWTPIETINWTKHELKPKFKPGNGFHYSDTNYELLGLIIENITQKTLAEVLHSFIFEPLGMKNTYQIFYSKPQATSSLEMIALNYKGINLSDVKSISMSCAGGGIVSTSEDMLIFIKSIVEHKIIKQSTFEKMCDYAKMGPSIYYGYGIMNFRFMFMPTKYHIWGNSGSIGAFMYYNTAMDIYIIGSYNRLNYQVQPIFHILGILRTFNKELKMEKIIQLKIKKCVSSLLRVFLYIY